VGSENIETKKKLELKTREINKNRKISFVYHSETKKTTKIKVK